MNKRTQEDEMAAAVNLIEIIEEARSHKIKGLTEDEHRAGITCRAAYLCLLAAHKEFGTTSIETYKSIMHVLVGLLCEVGMHEYETNQAMSIFNEGHVAILTNRINLLETIRDLAHVGTESFYPEYEFKLDSDKAIMKLVEARLNGKGIFIDAYSVVHLLNYIDSIEDKLTKNAA